MAFKIQPSQYPPTFNHLISLYLTLIKESGFSETTTTAPSFPTPPPPPAIQFLSVQLQLIAPMRPQLSIASKFYFFYCFVAFLAPAQLLVTWTLSWDRRVLSPLILTPRSACCASEENFHLLPSQITFFLANNFLHEFVSPSSLSSLFC
jgi:hypothetical protein